MESLEWERFLGLARELARTEPGQAAIARLGDSSNWAQGIAEAALLQQETTEISSLLEAEELWGALSELMDPEPSVERLEKGAVLEIAELALLRRWLRAVDVWRRFPREEVRGELFKQALSLLPDPSKALRCLERVLTPEGELSEKASPRLAELHHEIRALKREISTQLEHLLRTFSQKGVLQENFTDVRDGRYVIPVKISSQGEVDGIIYEASASRQTVFVEPKEIAPLNNRLRQRQNELLQEIYEVLKAASTELRPGCAAIRASARTLAAWDAVHARSRLSRVFEGRPIRVTEERRIVLRQTAHPLLYWTLPREQIVRNDVDFGEPIRSLLITGPNTGGKTVLLKTLGLAGICARTGFAFPASEPPVVPFFTDFFADLGDSQSIERHLSSFSGHVLKFKEILEKVTDRGLVLIDELNTATDPEEGAALGRAFLESVMDRGAVVVTTTHDPQLKALSISDPRILSASMAFDEEKALPTFRIVLNVPGRSRAIETARRLGIPEDVIARAKGYLSLAHSEFESVLSRMDEDARQARLEKEEAIALRQDAERLHREWKEKTQSSLGEMLERVRSKLRNVLEQAQAEVRETVQRLEQARTRREIDQTRASLNQSFAQASERLQSALSEEVPELARPEPEPKRSASARPLEVGSVVRVPKWKSMGKILEVSDGKVKVAMGAVQMSLSVGEIELLNSPDSKNPKQLPSTSRARVSHQPAPPPSRLDLRGVRFDEAMGMLERYLDEAFRSGGLAEVTIVHGLGTGALREGSRKLLSELPYIKDFRDGGVGAGGSGATIVEFES